MIAVDTSSWIAFLSDREPAGEDTALVESALAEQQVCLPPVVLTELLSDPLLPPEIAMLLERLPVLEAQSGFWGRTGRLRAKLLAARHRARLADALIAQSCIDHDVRLITRDGDFRHFAKLGRLRLAL